MDKEEDRRRLVVASRVCTGPLVGRGTGGRVEKIALALVEDHVSAVTCHFSREMSVALFIFMVSLHQWTHWASKSGGCRDRTCITDLRSESQT